MSKYMTKKVVISGVVLVALLVGVFFYVQYQRKVYRTLLVQSVQLAVLNQFLVSTFPDQVKSFNDMMESKNAQAPVAPAPLPETNPTP